MVTNFTLDKRTSELINILHKKSLIPKSKLIKIFVLTSLDTDHKLPQIIKILSEDTEIKKSLEALKNE